MNHEEGLDAASTFLGGYVKRWMEANYDRLMLTQAGQAARSYDVRVRYAIEAGLYGLLVLMNKQLPESTPLERLVKEVLLDAPPEVAKRLINGAVHAIPDLSAENGGPALRRLLGLHESRVSAFLSWIGALEPRQRSQVLTLLGALRPDELTAFLSLTPTALEQFVAASALESSTPKEGPLPRPSQPSVLHGLRNLLEQKVAPKQPETP